MTSWSSHHPPYLPALYLPLKIFLFLKHIILIQFSCDGCFIIFIFDRVNTADPVHFTLTPPECHMEIRNGYGTSGTRVTGPVHVGDPLTLLILMRSQWGMYYSFIHNTYRYTLILPALTLKIVSPFMICLSKFLEQAMAGPSSSDGKIIEGDNFQNIGRKGSMCF